MFGWPEAQFIDGVIFLCRIRQDLDDAATPARCPMKLYWSYRADGAVRHPFRILADCALQRAIFAIGSPSLVRCRGLHTSGSAPWRLPKLSWTSRSSRACDKAPAR